MQSLLLSSFVSRCSEFRFAEGCTVSHLAFGLRGWFSAGGLVCKNRSCLKPFAFVAKSCSSPKQRFVTQPVLSLLFYVIGHRGTAARRVGSAGGLCPVCRDCVTGVGVRPGPGGL